ncbi:MAG: PLP-dependent aminotransferase family protein [Actinomycetota bacterium]|nr:PLP-dependent aminotransferase family protein [Actinomycetota bacterium]
MSSGITFDPYASFYSSSSHHLRSSEIRDLMSAGGRGDVISFAGGLPFTESLPAGEVSDAMLQVLKESHAEALQYCETEGRMPLKRALIKVMASEGITAEENHILITTGSQQALDLLARIFIDPSDSIVVEGPTYVGALSAFRAAMPNFTTIPLDHMGMDVDILSRELKNGLKPKFAYVVPNFHNPAGVTMSAPRRKRLIELAEEYDFLIIEDNPYGLLRFDGEPLLPIVALEKTRVVYLGTLSKIVSPGIRIGWVNAPLPIIDRLAILKQSADLCSSSLNQMFAERLISRDLWKKNINNLKPIYKSRKDAMIRSLEKHFPSECRWTNPEGGLFIWVTLPEYLDTTKMLPLAIESGVAFVPGVAFFADGSGANMMRLNFSFPTEPQISEGIMRLGKVVEREISLYHSLGLNNSH